LSSNLSGLSSVLYKHFIICIKCIYLQGKYLIKPYTVGKDKKITDNGHAVQSNNVAENQSSICIFLLKVMGMDTIHLHIIGEEDLVKEDVIPVAAGTS